MFLLVLNYKFKSCFTFCLTRMIDSAGKYVLENFKKPGNL